MFDSLVNAANGAVALVAALLPSRYWKELPSLPIRRAAWPSAALSIVAGAVVGVGGFLEYNDRVGRELSSLIVKTAERQLSGELPSDPRLNTAPLAVAAMTPLAFLFTPLGLGATYLMLSGFARAMSWVVDEPWGDPILTGADVLVRRVSSRTRERGRQRARERAEGAEVPDRLYTADWANLTDADFVVVASRRKAEWEKGTFVITPDTWFVLGEPFDMRLQEGLRTVYPLKELKTLDVLRKGVHYELPPLAARGASRGEHRGRRGAPRARRDD